jgi:hypothetical protein
MTKRTTVSSAMTDEEAILVRLAESISRPGLDATSTLELIESWLHAEFADSGVSDEASGRFRSKLTAHGVDVEKLRLVIGDADRFPHRQEARDPAVKRRMRRVRGTVGRLLAGTAARHGEIGHGRHSITMSTDLDTSAGIIRRLNRDSPELAEQVAAGEVSANAAAVKAGYRRRKVSVAVDDPASAARTLRKHMTPGDLSVLRDLLE